MPATPKPRPASGVERQPRETELLDGGDLSPREVDTALDDLVRSHRRLFGYAAVKRALTPHFPTSTEPVKIIDLGSGPGDVGDQLTRHLERRGVTARVICVDRQLAHLLAGKRMGYAQLRVVADAEALPFRDGAFDWGLSHLVLHHFDPESNTRILAGLLRVAERVAAIDLLRSPLAVSLVPLALRFLRVGPVAFADGVVSIRQSYTLQEVRDFTRSFMRLELRRRFPLRFSLIITKKRTGSARPSKARGTETVRPEFEKLQR